MKDKSDDDALVGRATLAATQTLEERSAQVERIRDERIGLLEEQVAQLKRVSWYLGVFSFSVMLLVIFSVVAR